MIEKIKKEIDSISYYDNSNIKIVDEDNLFEILDKYKDKDKEKILLNTPLRYGKTYINELLKYKNAWEDMHKWFSQRNSKYDTPKSLEIENFVSTFMQELEKKHGIEVE